MEENRQRALEKKQQKPQMALGIPKSAIQCASLSGYNDDRHRMAWRLSLEVVGMAWRLSPSHGLCFCHGVAHRLLAVHGSQVVAMAWLTIQSQR